MAINSVSGSAPSSTSVGPSPETMTGGSEEGVPVSPVAADAFAPPTGPVWVPGLADAPPQAPADATLPTMRMGPGGVLVAPTSVISIDGVGKTVDPTLSANSVTTLDIRGSQNQVDLTSDGAPVAGAQANVILGGDHNSGSIDIQGTVVVNAGDHNQWVVNAPADKTFDEKALPKNVVLEGKASDWEVKYTPVPPGPRMKLEGGGWAFPSVSPTR